jgi:hypothetical protein
MEIGKMLYIRRFVGSGLPSSADSNGHFKVDVAVDWYPEEFMKGQFNGSIDRPLGSVIALSGLALCAQATTCSDYVKHHWPLTGEKVLDALQAALRDKSRTSTGTIT